MAVPMHQRVLPRESSKIGQLVDLTGKVGDFERLSEMIEGDLALIDTANYAVQWRQAIVNIRLRFGWNEERPGIPTVEGAVAGKVSTVCQRCLEPFELPLTTQLKLMLPNSGSSVAECDGYEIWEFEQDTVSPAEIAEEALIMAMPLSPMHDVGVGCGPVLTELPAEGDRSKPFADLRSLMAQAKD